MKETVQRASLRGVLRAAHACGLRPRTIIDVGVDTGTPELYDTFAGVHYVLIEPLAERLGDLERLRRTLGDAEIVHAAAAAEAGTLTLHVHADLTGSSVLRETDGPLADGEPRTVAAVTLDAVCAERNLAGPYLIKVDTQGSELQVLAGAARILAETELVVLEASLFGFFKGGPQAGDVIAAMFAHGFVLYDVYGGHYRPLDGALAQIDLVFARADGPLRQSHRFASEAQRAAHVENLRLGVAGRARRKLKRLLGLAPTPDPSGGGGA